MFNNCASNCRIIAGMNQQMTRLYDAAKKLHDVEGPSAVAKLLNVSPQVVHNWEKRAISDEGLLTAQEKIGCDAIWLRDGTGLMTKAATEAIADEIIELVTLYPQLTPVGRSLLLDLARTSPKQASPRWIRASND